MALGDAKATPQGARAARKRGLYASIARIEGDMPVRCCVPRSAARACHLVPPVFASVPPFYMGSTTASTGEILTRYSC